MRVLVFSSLFPNRLQPDSAVFIKNRMAAVQEIDGVDVKVVAPVPYFPSLPVSGRLFERWSVFSRIPEREWVGSLETWHPRYLVTPKIGMTFYGLAMYLGSRSLVRRLYRSFPFDIIDGHYIYPDGLAAILLGRLFKVPVVLSARGTDINLYPQFSLIKRIIQFTLQQADKEIAVCDDLKRIMVSLGERPENINVIPNGIDPQKFYRIEKKQARESVGIPVADRMLLSVGSLIERKGHHLLIEALGRLHQDQRLTWTTYIIGQGEWHGKLARLIAEYRLEGKVFLLGQVPNCDLVTWYNAADIFFLGSSREGWPNVISEALACGTPVVATPANGVPEIITSDDYGIIVEKREAESFCRELPRAFAKTWDYDRICRYGQNRTWTVVAREVYETLNDVLMLKKSCS